MSILMEEKQYSIILDKLKKLSPADASDWILKFDDLNKINKDKKKKCVACIAKKPLLSPLSTQSYGTFILYLDRNKHHIVNFDNSNCSISLFSKNDFINKTLQQLCRQTEWATIDVILETATKVEKSSAELTFTMNNQNIFTRVNTVCTINSSDEPFQLICDIFKIKNITSEIHPVSRSISLINSSDIEENTVINPILEHNNHLPQLNRTFSMPMSQMEPTSSTVLLSTPGRVKNSRKLSTSSARSTTTKRPNKSHEQKIMNMESIIDSVASGSNSNVIILPAINSSTSDNDNKPSVLKSILESNIQYPQESFQQIPQMTYIIDNWPNSTINTSTSITYNNNEYTVVEMEDNSSSNKKKKSKNFNQKATSNNRKKSSSKPKSSVEQIAPSSPCTITSNPTTMYQGSYPYPPGQQQQQFQSTNNGQKLNPGMFNPNMPSSSTTNGSGQMTSSTTYMASMGPPNMNGQMMYQQSMQLQQQQQQQQMMMQNNQWNQQQNMQGHPNMYHQQQATQQMYFNGQRPPHFMGPPQIPQQQQGTKKASKRKQAQRAQENQQSVNAMVQVQNAAINQQMMQQQQQPPVKQQYMNHPMFPNSSPQISGPNTPMPNHLSPYHPNQQQAQQQQQHYDWNKQATTNSAILNQNNRPNSSSEQVRADLRANIQARQHSSPQQMNAIMSPNDMQQQQQQRYMTNGPTTSISPPTMMSPPRVNQVSHPGHANQNYGPGSISQPSSSETNIFSPKNGQMYNSGYNNIQMQQQFSHQQNHQSQQMFKDFPVLSLEDCKEILQESDYGDFEFVGFDMINKPGFEFNFEESLKYIQKMSCP